MNNTPSQFLVIQDKATSDNLKLDFLRLKKAAMILRALNHKLRQQLLKLIDENQKITVTEIYVNLRLEQSVVSQHLAILRRAGIVITKREGKFIYYSLNYNRIKEVNDFVEQLVS
ncbi:MAG: helix-turn-helix transcriptional regulator [Parafilimonas sp.]|nr:helix-turn-helix transcriptional regulator [Parafilimonas sp.]